MIVIPATRSHIEQFSCLEKNPTVRAWVGIVQGKIVAVAGIAFVSGRWFAFCDLLEEAREFKMTIMRWAKRIMRKIKEMGVRYVYAMADPDEPGSIKWLESLGFDLSPKSMRLYRWSK